MSVAQSVHLRSNGLQCNKLNQCLSNFNWPMTAYVRNEGGSLKLFMVLVEFLRCTVTVNELSNQSMTKSISQLLKAELANP